MEDLDEGEILAKWQYMVIWSDWPQNRDINAQ